MGKYSTTRAFRNDRDRKERDEPSFSGSVQYFFEVPKDESQFKTQALLYALDPTGVYSGYLNYRDTINYWDDYLANTGLSWSDVRYPTRLSGFGNLGAVARNGVNFIGRNITRLYR